jgi:hypothetical protein
MCLTPITIKKNTADAMSVGCGHCIPCHLKYCNQWGFRFKIHSIENPIFYCVTLTYNNKSLPYITADNNKKYMTLVRAHATTFFKNLRNATEKRWKKLPIKRPKISYLICGEYGDKFKRPHYHAIIFNAHPDDILTSWRHGAIHFGNNNLDATLNYCLKYTLKSKIWKQQTNKSYERPFVNFSKGIGETCIISHTTIETKIDLETGEYTTHKKNHYISSLPEILDYSGIKILLPRYYSDKLNQKVDTEKYRIQAQEKYQEINKYLETQNLTRFQWNKMYHEYKKRLNNDQLYDNEIITYNLDSLLKEFNNIN